MELGPLPTWPSPTVTASLTHLLQERGNERKSTQEWRSGGGHSARSRQSESRRTAGSIHHSVALALPAHWQCPSHPT
ncbi:hypothetical protein NQZ68_005595 [Dissostichus eleginoides]|nr:hypothetical protein NQZ68_005595 [Dissostichus eleginoides]